MNTSTTTAPPTLTPASIALIEADATTRYGIELRHVVPDPEPAQVVKKPATSSASSKPKATKAITLEKLEEAIRRSGDCGLSASQIIALWADATVARRQYKRMLAKLGKVEKVGRGGRGMRYRIKE